MNYGYSIDVLPSHVGTITLGQTIHRNDLSPDQTMVYDKIIAWRGDPNARQYLKVGGYAGTGKTTLVAALARQLESQGESIAYAAFTGKAVNVLSKKLRAAGIYGQCSTLHSLMYQPKLDSKGSIEGWTKKEMLLCSMIVVDEASMVGAELWTDLLSYGLPILAVGDHGQLPPVGDAVVNLMSTPDLRLEKIHRQAEGNPILALAQWVREGNSHLRYEPTDSRVAFVPSFAYIADKVISDPNNAVALCYTNRTRVSLNKFARNHLGYPIYPVAGDTVVCLRNRKPIFNGMRGKLTEVDLDLDSWGNGGGVVTFEDDGLQVGGKLWYPQFNNPKTVDKLENSSQFRDVVIVWENYFRDADTRNRWMYTAVTRASEQLWIVRP